MGREVLVHENNEKELERLYKERTTVLSLPPEQTLNRILESSRPAALVHSFSDEDFYFLIHEIGPEDAIELLSLASNRQWEFFLDMEPWEKDRFRASTVTRWIDLFMKADPVRLAKWVLEEKAEFFELYLFKNIEIRIREHDEDPSGFGDDYMTLDDVHYVRFIEHPLDAPLSPEKRRIRDGVLTGFLKKLAQGDYPSYRNLITETAGTIPAESEEEMYRLRNVRMAEKGFLPYEEAVGIYQSLKPENLQDRGGKFIPKRITDLMLPVPVTFSRTLPEDQVFTRALQVLRTDEAAMQIQTEFASLCNRIISADRMTVRDRETLKGIVKKACGYLSIGLERLNPHKGKPDPERSAAMLVRHSLTDIFRVGCGAAQELKWHAEKWQKTAWFTRQNLSLSFWGEKGMGVLGGLLIRRPLFFDNYQTGVLYREFTSLEDVEIMARSLEGIMAFDELFSCLKIDVAPFTGQPFFTYQNCLLTFWAGCRLGLVDPAADPAAVMPLAMRDFKHFFSELWEGRKGARRVRVAMKAAFLKWLCTRTGLPEREILGKVGSGLEDLFSQIENEYGRVSPQDLHSKYIHLFLFQKPESTENGSNQR